MTKEEILNKHCGLALSMLSKEETFKNQILAAMEEYKNESKKRRNKERNK